jgi:hypothetical protein
MSRRWAFAALGTALLIGVIVIDDGVPWSLLVATGIAVLVAWAVSLLTRHPRGKD